MQKTELNFGFGLLKVQIFAIFDILSFDLMLRRPFKFRSFIPSDLWINYNITKLFSCIFFVIQIFTEGYKRYRQITNLFICFQDGSITVERYGQKEDFTYKEFCFSTRNASNETFISICSNAEEESKQSTNINQHKNERYNYLYHIVAIILSILFIIILLICSKFYNDNNLNKILCISPLIALLVKHLFIIISQRFEF